MRCIRCKRLVAATRRFHRCPTKRRYTVTARDFAAAPTRHQGFGTYDRVLHKVGRTVWGLQPNVSMVSVEELHRDYGSCDEDAWAYLSVSQKIDSIATKMLTDARREAIEHYDGVGDHPFHDGVLSSYQMWRRTTREVPNAHIEKIEAARSLVTVGAFKCVNHWHSRYRPGIPSRLVDL